MNEPQRHREHRVKNTEKIASLFVFLTLCSLCLCGSFIFFYQLGDRDLWASHEARAAQDAQRILDDGDWSLPRLFDDQVELQKPPLYYWLAAAAGWFRGGTVDAVAVRLPAALAGIATVLGVFVFLAARGRVLGGLFASLILATAQHFTWIARTGRIDVPLTFTVAASILCLWTARETDLSTGRAFAWNLAGYLAMAAGILLKGPIGLVLPLAVLMMVGLLDRYYPLTPPFRLPVIPASLLWGLPLIVAVAGPWFVLAHLRTDGEFTRVFFWYHHVQRATGGAATLATHPWWFYVPRLAFDFLPWSPLLIIAAWLTLRRPAADDPLGRLGLIWLLTILLLLSASRFKRADYLLPAYPGAAIWLGCIGERQLQVWRSPHRARWLALGVAGATAAVVASWAVYLNVVVPRQDAEHGQRSFAAAIRVVAPQPAQILLFRVEDHLLTYHLGRPLNTFLEWENLDIWAGRPGPNFVLMPAECAAEWRQYITSGALAEVLRFSDRTDRRRPHDLVLMRTRPASENRTDGTAARPPADQQGTDQHAAAGLQPGGCAGNDR
jgi:4-amino-4-deoxy-L-arabinose transferase-like glycosyltransferase